MTNKQVTIVSISLILLVALILIAPKIGQSTGLFVLGSFICDAEDLSHIGETFPSFHTSWSTNYEKAYKYVFDPQDDDDRRCSSINFAYTLTSNKLTFGTEARNVWFYQSNSEIGNPECDDAGTDKSGRYIACDGLQILNYENTNGACSDPSCKGSVNIDSSKGRYLMFVAADKHKNDNDDYITGILIVRDTIPLPCTPTCTCTSTTCTGTTCSNGCGGTCAGTKDCTNPCTPNNACAANTCIGQTCTNSCGTIIGGTKTCDDNDEEPNLFMDYIWLWAGLGIVLILALTKKK